MDLEYIYGANRKVPKMYLSAKHSSYMLHNTDLQDCLFKPYTATFIETSHFTQLCFLFSFLLRETAWMCLLWACP